MASRVGLEPPGRPEPGQILLVIHDFQARSSDELSLGKGDRVELIERDDDFGDGWYLGKHLTNGQSGLFPEVYTRPAPRGPITYANTRAAPAASGVAPSPASAPISVQTSAAATPTEEATIPIETRKSAPMLETGTSLESNRHASTSSEPISSPVTVTSPLQTAMPGAASVLGSAKFLQPNHAAVSNTILNSAITQDSPVMNETLSVINEHITDLNTPRQIREQRSINDSSSEYSSHQDHRMSYIHGEETDEEEDDLHDQEEVSQWTPDQVAEYLSGVGVESKHCEVFREQEISGDVLLEMEQTSLFIKEFELGSVGRRLKTWQKVKALQDEVKGTTPPATRRTTQSYGDDANSDAGSRRSRSNTATLPKPGAFGDRPGSRHNTRLSHQKSLNSESVPATPSAILASPTGTMVDSRPSAASIRELNHSRRNSSYDFGANSLAATSISENVPILTSTPEISHKKQPSFDRNWTMSSPRSPPQVPRPISTGKPSLPRPVSSTGLKDLIGSSFEALAIGSSPELDRGYFSGGEFDGRKRNVLRKKSGISQHSRNSSYAEEQRSKPASSHTRFGSVDSTTNNGHVSASHRYYGMMLPGRKRAPSATSAEIKPMSASKDSSPTVTRLDDDIAPSPRSRSGKASDWLLPGHSTSIKNRGLGLRAISDAITGNEKARIASPTEPISSIKESPMASPARTGSSTPSGGGNSFDSESPATSKSPSTGPIFTPNKNTAARKKSKKETSAYTRGLEKKTPQEQMVGCDYSGWMKKKNTNLMTTWKPRLFILKGRRLSYYYTENDEMERGLIDISGHRVLPAESDRLTGLHATLTGATKSPTSPSDSHTMTIAASEAAAEVESSLSKSSGDQMFIFKLVPPRAGQTRAVNFTKPTVHYFALPNIKQGRLWMAALMKATIDRDDSKPATSTYQQKTISLAKARAMRHRPPALMNLDEKVEDAIATPVSDLRGLNINGIIFGDDDRREDDSGVSGINGGGSMEVNSLDSRAGGGGLSMFSFDTTTLTDEKHRDTAV